ncbi:hypothetical protein HYH02_004462 [Chlamydomonas schloesseri]|uniref:Plastid lipid-associated protein/fibrillin conserved domain-containing protein n=1 Tax=Chlamydomonas schloesseri TaxID=2026947 RepID=A0A836B881_9CHLO|nr:hypothetical protein HYH02_004462 [Chlamydomonas schloesseri]|eukprot:KAG2450622.1 hypothetical protein HYH02_004462 [Chlamydomonas schloesseri]
MRHLGAQRAAPPRGGAWFGKGAQAPSSARKQRLLDLTSGSSYGAMSDSATAQQIERLVDELAVSSSKVGAAAAAAAAAALDGSWRLVYTTEKSVHSIVRGLPVCFVGQRISIGSSRVTNIIDFGKGEAASSGEGSFGLRASAPLTITGPNRIEYRFDRFKLLLPWRRSGGERGSASKDLAAASEGLAGRQEQAEATRLALPLPTPQAGGWTQGVFVDGEVRVMRNSQGDTLVFVREDV